MRLLFLACMLFAGYFSYAQTQQQRAAKAAAQNMGKALIQKDYSSFVKTTYPRALEASGGDTSKLIRDLKGQLQQMENEGTSIIAMWPGEPSAIIDTANELQCTIPQKMTMRLPEGKLTTTTTLIAFSQDNGTTWYFMDTADRSIGKMREMFPNISSRLVIQPNPQEEFEPNKK